MDHNQFSDMILDYINGKLDEKIRLEFQEHLLDCDNCTEELLLQRYILKKLENGSVSSKLRERKEKAINSIADDVAVEDEKYHKITKKKFNYHVKCGEDHLKKKNVDEAVLEFNKALETFNRALETFNNDISVRHKVSRIHFAIGIIQRDELFFDKAIAELKIIKEIEPTFFYAYENLSFIYYKRGEIDDAILELSEALKLKNNDAQLRLFLWALYVEQCKYNQAIDEAKKALELQPDNPDCYQAISKTYLQMGSYNEAIEYSKKIKEIFPENASGPIVLACAYEKKGMVEDAINEFEKVKKIDPKIVTPYTFLSKIYLDKGMVEKAVEELDKAYEIDPNDAQTNLGRGIAYSLKGEFDVAIESLNAVPVNTREYALASVILSIAYIMINKSKKAINCLENILDVKEIEHESRWAYALTLSAIGEYQSAICEFKKVIKLDKSNAHAHNHLGLLYAQMKQFEKAAKYLLAAIELEKTNNQFLVDYNFVNKQIERLKKGEKNLPGEFKVKQPDIISQHAFTDSILEKLSNVFVTFLILPKKYEMSRSILYPIKTKQYLYPTIFRTVG